MHRPGGYSIITEPGKRPVEHDTFTCAHCPRISFVKAGNGNPAVVVIRADGTNYLLEAIRCYKCWDWVCPVCAKSPECTPRMRCIEIEEAQAKRRIL